MENLSRKLFADGCFKSQRDLQVGPMDVFPEKVLQFGEGNFLRGFVDWMFNRLNANGLFNGSIVVVQPIRQGLINIINEQEGLYTLILRGTQNGEIVRSKELVTAISRGVDVYKDFNEYIMMAENPELRVIVSNTTEAGIEYDPSDKLEDMPPASFPGKLTLLLYRRYKAFKGDESKGFIIVPCELIDRNGDNLKKVVLRLAEEWKLGEDFIEWVHKANCFLNTLVDRIVTGYPKDQAETIMGELGYRDNLMDTGEIFHLWVIEGDSKLSKELPFDRAGLNVIWTEDMTPYRTRKVRILNGAHTMTVLAAYLYGRDTVKECIDDKLINAYMRQGIFEEIIPTLDLSKDELVQYAEDVMERFSNPFIEHYLLSISLNSVSKFKTRVLPSILEYVKRKGELPKILTFSLAALFAFYRGNILKDGSLSGLRFEREYKICDDIDILEYFKDAWSGTYTQEEVKILVSKLLSMTGWWGTDLNDVEGLAAQVSEYIYNIITHGIEKALKDVTNEYKIVAYEETPVTQDISQIQDFNS